MMPSPADQRELPSLFLAGSPPAVPGSRMHPAQFADNLQRNPRAASSAHLQQLAHSSRRAKYCLYLSRPHLAGIARLPKSP